MPLQRARAGRLLPLPSTIALHAYTNVQSMDTISDNPHREAGVLAIIQTSGNTGALVVRTTGRIFSHQGLRLRLIKTLVRIDVIRCKPDGKKITPNTLSW